MGENPADSANPGFLRPPLLHLAAIGGGAFLGWLSPASLAGTFAGYAGGIPGIAAGIALIAWCKRSLADAGTPLPGGLPTTAIVKRGPYALSRNPIYVAFVLIHLGTALVLDSAWILATLAPAVAVIALMVIPREERYLERKFGGEYLAYKASVRRWV